MPMGAIYESGTLSSTEVAQYRLNLNLPRSSTDGPTAAFLCRFIELWCGHQCTSGWRVEHHERDLVVAFESDRDCVLFSLTDEYEYMTSRRRENRPFTHKKFSLTNPELRIS